MAYIWQISVVKSINKSIINGVVLCGQVKNPNNYKAIVFASILGSYMIKPFKNREVDVRVSGNNYKTVTDLRGSFSIELDQEINEIPKLYADGEQLKIIQTYPIIFNDSSFQIDLISDVDDTILVSFTKSIWKRVSTLLFISSQKRKFISFTKDILEIINKRNGRIFFVSKSESNLFGLLSSFIINQNIPVGNLALTPYLSFSQLFNPKKGKEFKEKQIRKIIDNSPSKKFILIGDDTQQDILVYYKIANQYPGRILKIYIRKTIKILDKAKTEQLDKLINLAIPVLYFNDSDDSSAEKLLIDNY